MCIGTTNRFDLVDSAVSRSGRLGLHMELKAMDTDEKVEVLKIGLEIVQK